MNAEAPEAVRQAAISPAADAACIITGVAGAIGQALTYAFCSAGYRVIGTDRVTVPPQLPLHTYIPADLDDLANDQARIQVLLSQLREGVGGKPLGVLVNNAAVQRLAPTDDLTASDWVTTLNVNLLAPFTLTQALLPELQAGRGCVINISSIHARLTKPGFVAYATSKAALSGMTRALAVDLAGRVRVNAIEPAAIATDMLRAGFAGRDDAFAALEACHPQGRIGTPEEVAALALALADGHLRFLHGACIAMDGGIGGRLHDPV